MISAVSCKKSKRVTVLSQQDKYRKASHVTTKLTSLVSEAPMREFKQKLYFRRHTKGVGTRWKVHYSRMSRSVICSLLHNLWGNM